MNAPSRPFRRATAAMLAAHEPKPETPFNRAMGLIYSHITALEEAGKLIEGKPLSRCLMREIAAKSERVRWYCAQLTENRAMASHVCGMLGPNGHGPGIADVCRRAANFESNQAAFQAARSRAGFNIVERDAPGGA